MVRSPAAPASVSEGFLFDAVFRAAPSGMILWILGDDGRMRALFDPWRPTFRYLPPPGRSGGVFARLEASLRRLDPSGAARDEVRIEFWTDREVRVRAWTLGGAAALRRIVRDMPAWEAAGVRFFDADVPLETRYLVDRGLFPAGRVAAEVVPPPAEAGAPLLVREIVSTAGPCDDMPEPPLRVATLRVEAGGGGLLLEADGAAHGVEAADARGLVEGLNALVRRLDPDVLVTEGGDAEFLPALEAASAAAGAPLRLDRDGAPPGPRRVGRPGSFWSYNRIVRRHATRPLYGRWHLDRRHGFYFAAAGLGGLLEIARFARIPVQRMARVAPGTAVSSMQAAEALRSGILVPRAKGEPEGERSALDLLVADKGGLTYVPPAGAFGEVAELDFASMYPSIMVFRNVSPERLNCRCCPDAPPAPETTHRLCLRKEGLVPRVLRPLLDRRADWRRRRDAAAEAGDAAARAACDRRQTALKWALVCSFGFLGYRNARFGRIEAHECVTAHGREALLRAKEEAEARGFRLLHALTDSIWVTRPGVTRDDARALAGAVAAATGLPVSVEGIYRWVVFCPSRSHPGLAAPGRYFGAVDEGGRARLKVRGLAVRRGDAPPLVAETQRAALDALLDAPDPEALRALLPSARAVFAAARERLRRGEVPNERLLVETRLSQDPEGYRSNARAGVAARALARAGRRLAAGETVSYLVVDARSADPDLRVRPAELAADAEPDLRAYEALLERAWEEIAGGAAAPVRMGGG